MTQEAETQEQIDEQNYHFIICAKYDHLHGIFPDNIRDTGEPCSCGLQRLITRASLDAKIGQAKKCLGAFLRNDPVPSIKADIETLEKQRDSL